MRNLAIEKGWVPLHVLWFGFCWVLVLGGGGGSGRGFHGRSRGIRGLLWGSFLFSFVQHDVLVPNE